ncbi:hypothetical protein DL93DRAFT_2073247 [Clavulina sp. PMI_390]|nr:hypothetical protein DL93DRAFT_2073247 [Clavulina sp. PMI_390]
MSFVFRNPALAPLFAAVGAGILGAGWYGAYRLKNDQDLIIDKTGKPQPWQHVRQDQQTKLYTPAENREFWKARSGMASPSSIYSSAESTYESAKAKVKEIKERTTGH